MNKGERWQQSGVYRLKLGAPQTCKECDKLALNSRVCATAICQCCSVIGELVIHYNNHVNHTVVFLYPFTKLFCICLSYNKYYMKSSLDLYKSDQNIGKCMSSSRPVFIIIYLFIYLWTPFNLNFCSGLPSTVHYSFVPLLPGIDPSSQKMDGWMNGSKFGVIY